MGAATLVRAKGGTKERTVPLEEVRIPDAWHAAMRAGKPRDDTDWAKECAESDRKLILDLWSLAHSLLNHARRQVGLPSL